MINAKIGPKTGYRSADILLLIFLSATLTLGLAVFSGDPPRWMWIGYPLFLQVLLLVWVGTMPEHKGRFNDALRVTSELQVNVAMRIVIAVGLGLAVALLAYYFMHGSLKPARLVRVTLASGPLLLLFFSVWYLHQLRSRGLVIADLATGTYRRTEAQVAGPLPQVHQRLEHHLHTLVSDAGAPMPWTIYGQRPSVTRTHLNDHFVQYECIWTWCPTKVILSVRDDGAGTTMLRAHCELRRGYYSLELYMNAVEVVLLMAHLQANIVQLLQSEFALTDAKQRHEGLRREALEMELRVLQAQIEPHFFFNTLANLRQLYRTDIEAGEDMLDHLISYLRGAMDDLRSDQSSVDREFDMASHFLAIMKVRMGERLSYTFVKHDEIGEHPFPPAMLISLVENAVKHGLRDKADGALAITAARVDDTIRLSVADNGPGFSSVEGTGVGLSNIRQRLEAIYGHHAWLEVGAPAEGGFMSTIVIPVNSHKGA